MPQLADKLQQLRDINSGKESAATQSLIDVIGQIKPLIDKIPSINEDSLSLKVSSQIGSQIVSFNMLGDARKSEILQAVVAQNKHLADVSKKQSELMVKISDALSAVKAIKFPDIPELDTSDVKELIKNIKVTDVSALETRLIAISKQLATIGNKKPEKVDIAAVLKAIEAIDVKPRNVEFEVVEDAQGFPVKVIAKEMA